jgi:hypothetical protein
MNMGTQKEIIYFHQYGKFRITQQPDGLNIERGDFSADYPDKAHIMWCQFIPYGARTRRVLCEGKYDWRSLDYLLTALVLERMGRSVRSATSQA